MNSKINYKNHKVVKTSIVGTSEPGDDVALTLNKLKLISVEAEIFGSENFGLVVSRAKEYSCRAHTLVSLFGEKVGPRSCCGQDNNNAGLGWNWAFSLALKFPGSGRGNYGTIVEKGVLVCDTWMRKHLPAVYEQMVQVDEVNRSATQGEKDLWYAPRVAQVVSFEEVMVPKVVLDENEVKKAASRSVKAASAALSALMDDYVVTVPEDDKSEAGEQMVPVQRKVIELVAMDAQDGLDKVCADVSRLVLNESYRASCKKDRFGTCMETFESWFARQQEESARVAGIVAGAAAFNEQVWNGNVAVRPVVWANATLEDLLEG